MVNRPGTPRGSVGVEWLEGDRKFGGERAWPSGHHFKDADCPVARALDAVGERWSLLIVRDAFDGVRRFSEFQQSLGVSRGILATRLRRLVALGILKPSPASAKRLPRIHPDREGPCPLPRRGRTTAVGGGPLLRPR